MLSDIIKKFEQLRTFAHQKRLSFFYSAKTYIRNMFTVNQELPIAINSKYMQNVQTFTVSTIGNIVGMITTLPLIYATIKKQLPPPQGQASQTYRDIFKHILTREGQKDVFDCTKRMSKVSLYQSISFMGIANTYLSTHEDESIIRRGTKAGLLSGMAESILTTNELQRITAEWNRLHYKQENSKEMLRRSFIATSFKNSLANPLTLICILYAQDYTRSHCGNDTKLLTLATFSGTVLANAIFAPANTVLTRVQNDSSKGFFGHFRDIKQQSPRLLWSGFPVRAVQKGLQLSVATTIINLSKNSHS